MVRATATSAAPTIAFAAATPPLAERRVASPVGTLLLVADSAAVRAVQFLDSLDQHRLAVPRATDRVLATSTAAAPAAATAIAAARRLLDQLERELGEFFAGRRREFSVPVAPRGTPFQERVWRALLEIPYGTTASYGDIARAIGSPGAARAIGGANHENPIAIVIPCHRVIGANSKLVGYGGGLDRKHRLLALERAHG